MLQSVDFLLEGCDSVLLFLYINASAFIPVQDSVLHAFAEVDACMIAQKLLTCYLAYIIYTRYELHRSNLVPHFHLASFYSTPPIETLAMKGLFWAQFGALFWKNWIVLSKHPLVYATGVIMVRSAES